MVYLATLPVTQVGNWRTSSEWWIGSNAFILLQFIQRCCQKLWLCTVEWIEGCRRKRSLFSLRYYSPAGTKANHKNLRGETAGFRADIWTWDLLIAKQECDPLNRDTLYRNVQCEKVFCCIMKGTRQAYKFIKGDFILQVTTRYWNMPMEFGYGRVASRCNKGTLGYWGQLR
jgi:hypothetical protein